MYRNDTNMRKRSGLLTKYLLSLRRPMEVKLVTILNSINPFFLLKNTIKITRDYLCYVVGSRWIMPPDALQPKAYCTNPGL